MNRQLPMSGVRRRALPVGVAGKAARYMAPAVFLLVVTAAVLLVRSTLRSDTPAAATTSGLVTTRAATAPVLAVSPPSPPKQYYVIASGDTLDAIASRFATTVDGLLGLNPGIEPTALRPGEQIRVK
jgi:LysM repeat protein